PPVRRIGRRPYRIVMNERNGRLVQKPRSPEPDRTVLADGQQRVAVRAHRNRTHALGMLQERAEFLPAGHVPQLSDPASASREEPCAVGAESSDVDRALVLQWDPQGFPRRHFPEVNRVVPSKGQGQSTPRREKYITYRGRVFQDVAPLAPSAD